MIRIWTLLCLVLAAHAVKADVSLTQQCASVEIQSNVNCYKLAVKDFLFSWVEAWGNGDSSRYLAHYVIGKSPNEGQEFKAWVQARRQKIEGRTDIRIKLELQSMMLNLGGRTEVVLIQEYQSKDYQDRVIKKLFLVQKGRSFQIFREQTLSRL